MSVTLRQLKAFVAVARMGSFTLAAESLFITQSALSGLIKELEHSLGLRLFDRSTRRLYLSETARLLYPQVEKILHDLDSAIHEVGNLKALQGGSVRIAVPQLLACTLLPQMMRGFAALHPQVQLKLVDCAVENVASRVLSGEVDLGIGPEHEAMAGIDVAPLFTLPFVAVMPPGHALAQRKQLRWAQLAGTPLITLRGHFTEQLMRDTGEATLHWQKDALTHVTFMSTALAMVEAGLGMTVCLPYARAMVERHGLVMRVITQPVVQRSFKIFTRRGRSLPPAAQAFQTFVTAQLQNGRIFLNDASGSLTASNSKKR